MGLVLRVVPRGEKILSSGTDPESYINEYTLVYEDKHLRLRLRVQGQGCGGEAAPPKGCAA